MEEEEKREEETDYSRLFVLKLKRKKSQAVFTASSLAKGYDPLYSSSRADRNPWLAKMCSPTIT
jgi:hypothetical protein